MFKVLKALWAVKGQSKTALALVAVMSLLGLTNPVLLGAVSTAVNVVQTVMGG